MSDTRFVVYKDRAGEFNAILVDTNAKTADVQSRVNMSATGSCRINTNWYGCDKSITTPEEAIEVAKVNWIDNKRGL